MNARTDVIDRVAGSTPEGVARQPGPPFGRRVARAIASVRVGVAGTLAAAYAYALLAGADRWYATGTTARVAGLLAATVIAIVLQAGRSGTRLVLGAGVAVDVASLALAGCRAVSVPGGVDAALPLAIAEVALAAGVLALSASDVAAGLLGFRILAETAPTASAGAAGLPSPGAPGDAAARPRGDELAQLIVHDLRNPLTAVIANLRYVREGLAPVPENAEHAECLEIADREAHRLSTMLRDLLLVPRLERGEPGVEFASTKVRHILVAVAGAAAAEAAAKRVRLDVAAPGDAVAWLNAPLVRRMLENLVANGLRHTPAGGRVQLVAELEGDRLRLAVRNTGEPVAESVRHRLFQRYGSGATADRPSSGLGLYVCRLVAEAHGGGVALVERDGWTVSFEAELPVAGHLEREVEDRGLDR